MNNTLEFFMFSMLLTSISGYSAHDINHNNIVCDEVFGRLSPGANIVWNGSSYSITVYRILYGKEEKIGENFNCTILKNNDGILASCEQQNEPYIHNVELIIQERKSINPDGKVVKEKSTIFKYNRTGGISSPSDFFEIQFSNNACRFYDF
jgi:hypothetical protein